MACAIGMHLGTFVLVACDGREYNLNGVHSDGAVGVQRNSVGLFATNGPAELRDSIPIGIERLSAEAQASVESIHAMLLGELNSVRRRIDLRSPFASSLENLIWFTTFESVFENRLRLRLGALAGRGMGSIEKGTAYIAAPPGITNEQVGDLRVWLNGRMRDQSDFTTTEEFLDYHVQSCAEVITQLATLTPLVSRHMSYGIHTIGRKIETTELQVL